MVTTSSSGPTGITSPIVVDAHGADSLDIPGDVLTGATDFVRQGPDLLLIGAAGQTVLVRGFFAVAEPPALVTTAGAHIAPELAIKLAGPAAPAQVAQAAPVAEADNSIGVVETVEGTVTVTRADGTTVALSDGDALFLGDVIATGPGGAIGVILADDTTFSMGEEGRMTLDELVYDPGTQEGSALLSLLQGTAVVVSGQIAKTSPDAMTLATPVGTIGIRGTSLTVQWDGTNFTAINLPETTPEGETYVGEITFFSPTGEFYGALSGGNSGWRWTPAAGGRPQSTQFTKEDVQKFAGALMGILPVVEGGNAPSAKENLEDFDTAAGDDDSPDIVGEFVQTQIGGAGDDALGPVIPAPLFVPPPAPTSVPTPTPAAGGDDDDPIPEPTPPPPGPKLFQHVQIGNDLFLQGTFMEAGINDAGVTIADGSTEPPDFHPTNSKLGFVADLDGWDQGATPPTVDFTFPGSPVDNVSVGWDGAVKGVNVSGSLSDVSDDGTNTLGGSVTATYGGMLDVTQTTTFGQDDTFMRIEVTLTNTDTSNTLSGVRYMRNIDPDQENGAPGGFGATTKNDVLSNPGENDDTVVAQSTGINTGISVNFVAFDLNARGSIFGFSNTNPFAPSAFNTPADPNGTNADDGLNIAFAVGDLAPGASHSFTYYWSINNPAVGSTQSGGESNDLLVGTGGNDSVIGAGGDDILLGLGGNDTILGNEGNDTLRGGDDDDNLLGGDGDDILIGGDGGDTLLGGDGADTAEYTGASSGVTVDLSTAAAQDTVGAGTDTLSDLENLTGSDHDDTLTGDGNTNTLRGGKGDDVLTGGDGDDRLLGEAGDDVLTGGDGDDEVDGGDGDDTIIGGDGAGDDDYEGGDGVDTVSYASTTDGVVVDLEAGTAEDAAGAGDVIGDDQLLNIERVIGGAGNDVLRGSAEADILNGGEGDDLLDGRDGADTADYQGAPGAVTVDLSTIGPQDTGGAGIDTLISIENLIGSDDDDILTGDGDNNVINGGAGDDVLDGGGDTDTADYTGATAGVTVDLSMAGVQQDTVGAGLDTLSNFENLTGSDHDDSLTGDGNANVLNGGGGRDVLNAGDDDDQVNGGAGSDFIVGGSGGGDDTYNGGSGFDTVSYTSTTDGIVVDLDDGSAVDAGGAVANLIDDDDLIDIEAIIGGTGDDVIKGDSGANGLTGNQGDDELDGRAGDDFLSGNDGEDELSGGAGNDFLEGGDEGDELSGGDGRDTLRGENGNDDLDGGIGHDQLVGGAGIDTLTGGEGNDVLIGDNAPQRLYVLSGDSDDVTGIFAIDGLESATLVVSETAIQTATGIGDSNLANAGLAVDVQGNLYFTESVSNTLLKQPKSGGPVEVVADANAISTAAGLGGATPDPRGLTIGSDGKVYFTEGASESVLSYDPVTDTLSQVVGRSTLEALANGAVNLDNGIVASPLGRIYVASAEDISVVSRIFEIDISGTSPTVRLLAEDPLFDDIDEYMTLAPNGDLIIADEGGSEEILRVDASDGTVSVFLSNAEIATVAGIGGGLVNLESGMVFDAAGNFYLGEDQTDAIYKWTGYDPATGTINGASGAVFVSEATLETAGSLPADDTDLQGQLVASFDFGATVGVAAGDTLFGGDGDDILVGGDGDDSVSGGAGNDTIIAGGGDGDDEYDGGSDIDTIDYSSTTDGVIVDLVAGTAEDAPGADTDLIDDDDIINIENVIGGSGNDVIEGDAAANTLRGGGGDDTLRGAGGNDTFVYVAISEFGDFLDDFTAGGSDDAIDFNLALLDRGGNDHVHKLSSGAVDNDAPVIIFTPDIGAPADAFTVASELSTALSGFSSGDKMLFAVGDASEVTKTTTLWYWEDDSGGGSPGAVESSELTAVAELENTIHSDMTADDFVGLTAA